MLVVIDLLLLLIVSSIDWVQQSAGSLKNEPRERFNESLWQLICDFAF